MQRVRNPRYKRGLVEGVQQKCGHSLVLVPPLCLDYFSTIIIRQYAKDKTKFSADRSNFQSLFSTPLFHPS
jgi:hypothetical protein